MEAHHVDLATIVLDRARVEGTLVMVDDFINHRVEPAVMRRVGVELAAAFEATEPRLILTAEASGIPPAAATADVLGIPYVYAKKYLGTGDRSTYFREVASPTKGIEYRVEVARRMLDPGDRVLVIDDFLSGGRTAQALGEITEEAGCELVGLGFIIEKSFMPGRGLLDIHGWNVHSLIRISSIDGGQVTLVDEPQHSSR
jgi:xanthine phosphoribosyltransferase